jgi:hypothetical protein
LQYLGTDQSSTMARRAAERLEPFGERVQLRQTDGAAPPVHTKELIQSTILRP